jgi:leucyl-tRNA synthetase
VEWTASGAEAAFRHLGRVYRIAAELVEATDAGTAADDDALARACARAIVDVTEGIEGFAFNTSVAKLYTFTNTVAKSKASAAVRRDAMKVMAQLMQPMTPHVAEEIWSILGGAGLAANAPWPTAAPELLVEQSITLPIQVNGKRRAEITVAADASKEEIEKIALANEAVVRVLDGATPKKVIVVPGRIVNVVA